MKEVLQTVSGDEAKMERKMTEVEKKIFAGTPEGRVLTSLNSLSKNSSFSTHQIKEQTDLPQPVVGKAIRKLIEGGIVRAEQKRGTICVSTIHMDWSGEIRNLLMETKLYKIYSFITESKEAMPISKISKKLKFSYKGLEKEIEYLKKTGLIKKEAAYVFCRKPRYGSS